MRVTQREHKLNKRKDFAGVCVCDSVTGLTSKKLAELSKTYRFSIRKQDQGHLCVRHGADLLDFSLCGRCRIPGTGHADFPVGTGAVG